MFTVKKVASILLGALVIFAACLGVAALLHVENPWEFPAMAAIVSVLLSTPGLSKKQSKT